MEHDERADGLAELLLDATRAGQPDSALLARFALDPAALSREERDEVETFLARHPEQRTSISALRSLQLSERLRTDPLAAATSAPSPSVPVGEPRVERGPAAAPSPERARAPRRLRRGAGLGVAAILTAAAAALLVWLPRDGDVPASAPAAGELRTEVVPESPDRRTDRASETARADLGLDPAPPTESDPAATEAPGTAALLVGATPASEEESGASATDSDLAARDRGSAGDPAALPRPRVESPREPERREEAIPRSGSEPAPVAEPQPVQLALVMPTYAPGDRARARRQMSAVQRSQGTAPELAALAPAHVAETTRTAPSLYWYVGALPAVSQPRLVMVLADDDAARPLVDVDLPRPDRAGIQSVDLSRWLTALPLARELRWSIVWPLDPDDPSDAAMASGWLRRVEVDPSVARTLAAASPGARADILARAGLWYDALSELAALREARPDDGSADAALRTLLDQGGLESIPLR